jgi:hypothetical protein
MAERFDCYLIVKKFNFPYKSQLAHVKALKSQKQEKMCCLPFSIKFNCLKLNHFQHKLTEPDFFSKRRKWILLQGVTVITFVSLRLFNNEQQQWSNFNYFKVKISTNYFLWLEKKSHLSLKIYNVTIRPLNWTDFSD